MNSQQLPASALPAAMIRAKVELCIIGTLAVLMLILTGCSKPDERVRVTMWHQMVVGEREVLAELIEQFESENPGIRVDAPYKETEQLRSGFEAAAQAGGGPELVFGPSDVLGAFVTMGIVQDMSPWFDADQQQDFLDQALTWLPPKDADSDRQWLVQIGDRVGNHLALVYNRNLLPEPPENSDQMIEFAVGATRDTATGKQYGLVWNFVEPFFLIPFLTGHGAWVFREDSIEPNLDTPECVAALDFVAALQNRYKVLPANCDYETADSLFKNGSAAMIINGDWSWAQYLADERIDAVVVPLPIISSTGIPMGPMVATKGYSLNVHAVGSQAEAAMKFVEFMTSESSQREFLHRLKTLPSRKKLLEESQELADPTLAASLKQMENGRAMPVVPELRAVWDAMRPSYQQLLNGAVTPSQAASEMQAEAIQKIANLNRRTEASVMGLVLQISGWLMLACFVVWQRKNWLQFLVDFRRKPLAYLLILPSMLVIALTIVYPFIYNVVLSFSNMSLHNFDDWQVTGFQNYVQVLSEWKFFSILIKTIIWTVVCVFFHLLFGLLLATCLNAPIRGRSIYRIVLILPWAIPAYVTALTWRGMFNFDFGAINLMVTNWLGFSQGLNWLGDETLAFVACIITNVWLGFPFMMIIALGGMQGIPTELYEAARIDRIPRWKQFWHITLPMLKPVLIPATTLGAIWTFNNLNVVWLVSNTGEPADKTHILVSYVYKAVFNLYQYGYGAALSMLIFLLLLAFSLVFLHQTKATEGIN